MAHELLQLETEQIDFLRGLVADYLCREADPKQCAYADEILSALDDTLPNQER